MLLKSNLNKAEKKAFGRFFNEINHVGYAVKGKQLKNTKLVFSIQLGLLLHQLLGRQIQALLPH
jgi:hypothetical protein